MKEKENRLSIGTINGIDIYAVTDENGQTLVPIRPICDAIGVDYKTQYSKVNEDEILSSVVGLRPTTGADGKTYDMVCLPLEYVYGWIFTINPRNVNPQSKESVIKYKRECYEVLYRYFFGRNKRMQEYTVAERETLNLIQDIDNKIKEVEISVKELKSKRAEAKVSLEKIRSARLDDRPSLFD